MTDQTREELERHAAQDWSAELETDTLIQYDSKFGPTLAQGAFACRELQRYIDAAELQIHRILEARDESEQLFESAPMPPPSDGTNFIARRQAIRALMNSHRQAFALQAQRLPDAHFYLACWGMVANYERVVGKAVQDPRTTPSSTIRG
jgi:hypothetical protein